MNTSAQIANFLSVAIVGFTAYLLWKKQRGEAGDSPTASDGGTTTTSSYPNPNGASRGYRNNNPLNIEYSPSTVWQGEIRPSGDSRFAQFASLEYGYRAAFKTLNTYMTKYGLTTLQQIIGRWDSAAVTNYVNFICSKTGWTPETTFAPTDKMQLIKLVYNMAWMENGFKPALGDVSAGWNLYQMT